MPQLAKLYGVMEQLKAESQMEWVRQMNAYKAQAEAIVKFESIFVRAVLYRRWISSWFSAMLYSVKEQENLHLRRRIHMKYKGTLIVVKDCNRALKFYCDMFGFQLFQDNDGKLRHDLL